MKTLFALILVLFLFPGCNSGDKMIKDKSESLDKSISHSSGLNIEFKEVYSWLNLMPGPRANPTFHITGEYELYDSDEYDLNELKLEFIKINQDEQTLYEIEPRLRVDENLSTAAAKFVIFSMEGISVPPELNEDAPIDVEFIFTEGTKRYSYIVNELSIEKAY